jgi:hypothetical protein
VISIKTTTITSILILLVLSACSTAGLSPAATEPWGFPAPDEVLVEENEGAVCFTEVGEAIIKGRIFPRGCYSGSCTRPASQNLVIVVDHELRKMDFEYAFVIEDYASHYGFMCTEDCGSGLIWFEVEDLKVGTYAVWVGGDQIGEIQIPSESFCLEVEE